MSQKPRTVATYKGDEFDAAFTLQNDGQVVTLVSNYRLPDFTEVGERFTKEVPLAECESLRFERSIGTYRTVPVLILETTGTQLYVESLANNAPLAANVGLVRIERGVYRGWVPAGDVSHLRVDHVDLTGRDRPADDS